jgi:hypothetical protein
VKQLTRRNDENILGFRVDSEKEMIKAAFKRNKKPTAAQRDAYRAKTAMTKGISIKMLSDILTALQSPQETEFANSNSIQDRTIVSSDCDVSTFEFDLSNVFIQKLLDSGKAAAETFLKTGTTPYVVSSVEASLGSIEDETRRMNEAFVTAKAAANDFHLRSLATDVQRLRENAAELPIRQQSDSSVATATTIASSSSSSSLAPSRNRKPFSSASASSSILGVFSNLPNSAMEKSFGMPIEDKSTKRKGKTSRAQFEDSQKSDADAADSGFDNVFTEAMKKSKTSFDSALVELDDLHTLIMNEIRI